MSGAVLSLFAAVLAGAVLGGAYLALLWVAVQHLPKHRRGVLVFVALGLARAALLLGAFTTAAALGVTAEGLIAGLAGFVAVRLTAVRALGRGTKEAGAWK